MKKNTIYLFAQDSDIQIGKNALDLIENLILKLNNLETINEKLLNKLDSITNSDVQSEKQIIYSNEKINITNSFVYIIWDELQNANIPDLDELHNKYFEKQIESKLSNTILFVKSMDTVESIDNNLKIMIPAMKLNRYSKEEIEERAYQKLKLLGIEEQALKPASKLSGGQQQRVAIARALINNPKIIMSDEPTGNLDSKNTHIILDIFQQISKELNQTIVAVTHDNDFANTSDRIIEMQDGKIL